jgi:hypothetical protein
LTKDISRVLREHVLDGVRARLRDSGPQMLLVTGREGAAALRAATAGDSAWLELGSRDELEVPELGRELARVLRPGAAVVCLAPSGVACRSRLAPFVEWRRARGFGILLPAGPEWPSRHPLAFALLAAVEHVVSGWPFLRGRGGFVLHEGVRR